MKREIEIVLLPEEAADESRQKEYAARQLELSPFEITHVKILRRSIDARSRQAKIRVLCEVFWKETPPETQLPSVNYGNVNNGKRILIIGSGPAGLFAALRCIDLGLKPIVIERGKDVQARRRDLAAINKEHIVNPDSNYCFGEGGAGTYSDGKLYTRSSKRGSIQNVLNTMVAHGATPDILIDAHPHIGTNKLPKLIAAIRDSIKNAGGEIHFNTRLEDLIISSQRIKGIIDQEGNKFEAEAVILATGHSARDIFRLLHRKKILIESKPFALGVRIEHPQQLIDSIQYHCEVRSEFLPAASYSLVEQVKGRGVFSFCMCPGGFIVPSATAPGEIVVNGMSPSKRDSRFSNSGMVVSIELEDYKEFEKHGPLAGLEFQQMVEQNAFKAGGMTQSAPAQRMVDFVNKRSSATLPETSYQPGTTSTLLTDVLPRDVAFRLQEGFKAFGKKMPGYFTNEAILLGVESRTSSPVRIPRNSETLQHPEIEGLFPCGEGAGFAGGIVSAAMDGERCAEKCFDFISKLKS